VDKINFHLDLPARSDSLFFRVRKLHVSETKPTHSLTHSAGETRREMRGDMQGWAGQVRSEIHASRTTTTRVVESARKSGFYLYSQSVDPRVITIRIVYTACNRHILVSAIYPSKRREGSECRFATASAIDWYSRACSKGCGGSQKQVRCRPVCMHII
jgi:hypothetical protein